MTLVIALKVGDGVVLGADSASTISAGNSYINSYFNAEKLFNLPKGYPVGALTFGLGGLQSRSIGSLAKDLRARFLDTSSSSWHLPRDSYTVEQIADGVRRFFYDELYEPQFAGQPDAPSMGFFVAGYSAGSSSAEVWRVSLSSGNCDVEQTIGTDAGWDMTWEGVGESMFRLVRGWSSATHERLVQAGMPPEDAVKLLDAVQPLVHPTMPIQDAIDLVHYLMDVAIGFVRFSPGAAVVAPPIDSAAITRHEGFRWVRRKHYFSPEFNRA